MGFYQCLWCYIQINLQGNELILLRISSWCRISASCTGDDEKVCKYLVLMNKMAEYC